MSRILKQVLGIDCGSVSLKLAVMDENRNIVWQDYRRTHGQPVRTLAESVNDMFGSIDADGFNAIVATGSARGIVKDLLQAFAVNEILTHGTAGGFFHPNARSIIEIGGQDSKLIFLDKNNAGETVIVDSAMNDICAAGTGSFLDQQAFRMGIGIEKLSLLAALSENPAKIAGRCSVFTKTDMIHLQQGGVPKEDLAAGLCEAVVRTYIESLVKGKEIEPPILFQGGVANNQGIRKAFEKQLHLSNGDMIVPDHFGTMGAVGACLYALKKGLSNYRSKEAILSNLAQRDACVVEHAQLAGLSDRNVVHLPSHRASAGDNGRKDIVLGVDVGSVTVKLVALDGQKRMIYKKYIPINGEPIESVKTCLDDFHGAHADCSIRAVGVTGSGRNYIANAIGADTVRNEITAHAYAAVSLVPDVDTIIEIGGQDSKFIRIKDGTVVDFIMNKTCAAGTGSFLAEQAGRLNVNLEKEFSDLAMSSLHPVDMGTRCTVFMETDCIHYQQNNVSNPDILAGLSYSIAKNYLEKVVGNLEIGNRIVFQGGVAFNRSVAAAFGTLLEKEIVIPPDHEVTGALGIALTAFDEAGRKGGSSFVGFDFADRIKSRTTLQCRACSNVCSLISIKYNDGAESIYGGSCGKYEDAGVERALRFPDYFEQREALLNGYKDPDPLEDEQIPQTENVIGIPSVLLYFELFPMWATFFRELGYRVVTSNASSKQTFQDGLGNVLADTCFPIKAVYGSIRELERRGVDKFFAPFVINMPDDGYDTSFAHNCQYVQIIPDMIRASMKVNLISPVIRMKAGRGAVEKTFVELGVQLGAREQEARLAYRAACAAQDRFHEQCGALGYDALEQLRNCEQAFVLMGHSYIIHDGHFNLNIAKRLARLGIPVVPADILPLGESDAKARTLDLVWKTNNRAINSADFINHYNARGNVRLLPVLMTTFGCASDSMLTPYLGNVFDKQPWLEIELDEHNSITGILTRCEAFWESVKSGNKVFSSFNDMDKFRTSDVTIEDIRREDRTLYVHEFSEAFVSVVDVLRKHGIRSELIAETSVQSNMLGRKLSNEKHCRTYQVLLGDYMATAMGEGYDPEKSVFMTFGYDEACRLALFKDLHEIVLKEKGAGDVWLFGPTPDDPIDWIKKFGLELSLDMWEALVAHDYLSRYKFEIRPFEKTRGGANRAYRAAVDVLRSGVRAGAIAEHFRTAMNVLKNVKVQERDLVKIGVVGDAFTRVHKYGMNAIFEEIEKNGGVLIIPPSWHDFIIYGAEIRAQLLKDAGLHDRWELVSRGVEAMASLKERIEKIAGEYSDMFPDQSNAWLMRNAGRYMNTDIAPVIPSMFIGKTVDFVEQRDIDGLMNSHGFNCILGKISTACYNPIRIANGGVPMLTFIDDGLQQTNITTRVEAFMDQARAFRDKKMMNRTQEAV